MIGARTIEQELHIKPVISSQMEEAIERWTEMYKGQAPWIHEPSFADPSRVVSLGLPAMIASEKARTALLEFTSEVTTPVETVEVENPDYVPPTADTFGNIMPSIQPPTIKEDRPISDTARADYLNTQYEKLKTKLRTQIEYGIAKGGLVIKPYPILNNQQDDETVPTAEIEFDFVQADAFYPLAFDASGRITEAAFLQTKAEKDTLYRRLEYHKWNGSTVEIVNTAYKSSSNQIDGDMSGLDLGQEVALNSVPEWKDLQPKAVIKNVHRPLFAYFKVPEANTIDTSSPLGVSGFSRAEKLIKDADLQYSRLLWEYEGGELAVDIDRDAMNFAQDSNGSNHPVMGHLQQRLYRPIDLGEANTYQPYSPALRDSSYIQGLNTILMRIEDVTGLSRGTISDAAAEARTATELKILKQRSYQTNADVQHAIQVALEDTIYIMNVYCDLYNITPTGEYEVSYEWDDSILVDVDSELSKRLMLMQNGLSSKIETRMWYFGETENQAREALMQVAGEQNQAAEQELMKQQNLARQVEVE